MDGISSNAAEVIFRGTKGPWKGFDHANCQKGGEGKGRGESRSPSASYHASSIAANATKGYAASNAGCTCYFSCWETTTHQVSPQG
jgi:hypothetical protein